jgi:hypothetical protein
LVELGEALVAIETLIALKLLEVADQVRLG